MVKLYEDVNFIKEALGVRSEVKLSTIFKKAMQSKEFETNIKFTVLSREELGDLKQENRTEWSAYTTKFNLARVEVQKEFSEKIDPALILEYLHTVPTTKSDEEKNDALFTSNSTKDGVSLQMHILYDLNTDKELGVRKVHAKLKTFLKLHCPAIGWLPKTDNLLERIIQEMGGKHIAGQGNLILNNKKGGARNVKSEVKPQDDKKNKIDVLFQALRNGRGKTFKGGFKDYMRTQDHEGLHFTINPKVEIVENWLSLIKDDMENQKALSPVRLFLNRYIKNATKQGRESQGANLSELQLTFEADTFIDTLDLKGVQRRDKIYDFWEETNKKYSEVVKAIVDFQTDWKKVYESDSFKELSKGKDRTETLMYELGKKLNDLKIDNNTDSLNYIVKVNPLTIENYLDEELPISAFENFISTSAASKLEQEKASWEKSQGKEGGSSKRPANTDGNSDTDGVGMVDNNERLEISDSGAEVNRERTVDEETDDEMEAVTDYDGEGMSQGVTASIDLTTSTYIDDQIESLKNLSYFQRTMSGLTTQKVVDPLFFYAFKKDAINFKELVVHQKDISRIHRFLDTVKSFIDLRNLDIDIDEKLLKYKEEISNNISKDAKLGVPYYLPVSSELMSKLDNGISETPKEIMTRVNNIKKLLKIISSIIDFGDSQSQGSKSNNYVSGGKDGASFRSTNVGFKNQKTMIDTLEASRPAFDNAIDKIIDFYIKPLENRQFRPFGKEKGGGARDSKYSFTNSIIQDMLGRGNSKQLLDPYFLILSYELQSVSAVFQNEDMEAIQIITDILNMIDDPSVFDTIEQLRKQILRLETALQIIFGKSFTESIRIELGDYFHDVVQQNFARNKEDEVKESIFQAESIEWKNQKLDNHLYPLSSLLGYMNRNASEIEDFVKNNSKNKEILSNFKSILDTTLDKITKSETEENILNAHDDIRKMLGKPIFYKKGKLDNYNHIENTLNIMKKEYNVELTAMDITSIVHEVDSMQSIGLKYGMSAEGVYFLKANFR